MNNRRGYDRARNLLHIAIRQHWYLNNYSIGVDKIERMIAKGKEFKANRIFIKSPNKVSLEAKLLKEKNNINYCNFL